MELLKYMEKLVHMMPLDAAPYNIYYLPEALKKERSRTTYGLYIATGAHKPSKRSGVTYYSDLGILESEGEFLQMLTWDFGPAIGRSVRGDNIGLVSSVERPCALTEYATSLDLVQSLAAIQHMDYVGMLGPSSALLSREDGIKVLKLDTGHPSTGIGSCLIPSVSTDNVFTAGKVQDDDDEDYDTSSSIDDEDNGDASAAQDWHEFSCHGEEVVGVSYDKKKLIPGHGAGPALTAFLNDRLMSVPVGIKLKADEMVVLPASPDKLAMMQMFLKGLMV